MIFKLACFALLFLVSLCHGRYAGRPAYQRKWRCKRGSAPMRITGLRPKKPAWVRYRVLELQECQRLSHRKLAALFNQLYFAKTGVSIGRTWVRELLVKEAHAALHGRRELKHRVPARLPNNRMWGLDTTTVTDSHGVQHQVLGAIDHGSRLNLMLRYVRRFNRWTFLGYLFLAIGEFGAPTGIKTDNHPVFRCTTVRQVLHWFGIGLRHSRPARPWENGYIERLFGTFKRSLTGYVIHNADHLHSALPAFQFWYNVTRPHQHLGGQTPQQAWLGIDPLRRAPRSARGFSAWGGRLRGLVLLH